MLRACAVALVALMMVSGGAWAQAKKGGKKEQSQFAKVVKVDGENLTVSLRDRKAKKDIEKTIKVDSSVKLVSIKEGFKLTDLKAGDEVLLIEKEGKVTEIRVVTEAK